MTDLAKAIDKFFEMREELYALDPLYEQQNKDGLESITPCDTSSTEAIWLNFWQKPIRAAKNIDASEPYVEDNKERFEGIWKDMTVENNQYEVKKISSTGNATKNEKYELIGEEAKKLVEDTRIACYRLFAISNGGVRFNERVKKHGQNPFPELVPQKDLEAYIYSDKFAETVQSLYDEMGMFWGPVTICHLMTDCGLSIKPDIHAVTTLKYLKVLPATAKRRMSEIKHCVEAVRDSTSFCKKLHGEVTAANLRTLDLDLLRMGREFELEEKVEKGEFAF